MQKTTIARLLALAAVGTFAFAAHAAEPDAQAAAQPAAEPAAQQGSDAALAESIKAALSASPVVAGQPIAISCKDGVVTLAGSASADAAQQALKLAAAVPGVKEVRSELKLQG